MTAFETSRRAAARSSLSRSAASSSRIMLFSAITSAIVELLTEEEGHQTAKSEEGPEGNRLFPRRGSALGDDVERCHEDGHEGQEDRAEHPAAECKAQQEDELRVPHSQRSGEERGEGEEKP